MTLDELKPGDVLDAYEDGKLSPSRYEAIVVDEVKPIGRLTRRQLAAWRRAIMDDLENVANGCVSYWFDGKESKRFWDWHCETFIIGHIDGNKESMKDKIVFAEESFGRGWYGVNWNYQLDIPGELREKCWPRWKKCAEERGEVVKWDGKRHKYQYFNKKTGELVCEY